MLTALLILGFVITAVFAAELVRLQCRRMLRNPHPRVRRTAAQTALAAPALAAAAA